MRDWRMGLYASTAVGFLQDPLRKLVPDQPVTYTVLVVVVFAACVLGALLRGELPRLGEVFRWYPNLRAPVALFATLVLLQSLRTLLVSRSLVLAGLGVLSYLSPVVAIVLGQRLFASPDAFARWLRFYLLATTVVTATVFAQFFGTSNTLFASIGLDTVYGVGGRIQMMCGVMRSSEIAAWHIGIGACVALTFSTTAVRVRSRLVYSFVAAVSLLAVFLTGRRKMLAEFALFLLCYLLLLLRHQQGATRIVRFAAVGALGLVAAASYLIATGREDRLLPYLSRGVSVIQESEQRLSGMTVSQFGWVVESNGFLGSGAGDRCPGLAVLRRRDGLRRGWRRRGCSQSVGGARRSRRPGGALAGGRTWRVHLPHRAVRHCGERVDGAPLLRDRLALSGKCRGLRNGAPSLR